MERASVEKIIERLGRYEKRLDDDTLLDDEVIPSGEGVPVKWRYCLTVLTNYALCLEDRIDKLEKRIDVLEN